jgi:predicted N-acetyltransferase YhbS
MSVPRPHVSDTPSRVTIRTVRSSDLEPIVTLDASVFGAPRRAYFERRLASLGPAETEVRTIGLVAELEGAIVGLVMGTVTYGEFGFSQITALIDSIAVQPDHQGQGIGRQLAIAFLAESAKQGATEVYTLVNWNAWDMLRFFDSLGFALATTVPLRRRIERGVGDAGTDEDSQER